MSECKYTPGPWTYELNGSMVDTDGNQIKTTGMTIVSGHVIGDTETIANADLIAAAPELLESLEALRDRYVKPHMTIEDCELWTKAESAIKKALGESK